MAGLEPGPRDPQPMTFGISTAPSYDVIERCPPHGADLLRKIRQRFTDLNLLIPKHGQMHEASTAKQRAEARLRELTDHQQDGGYNLKPTDARVVEQQRLVEKLSGEFTRLIELSEARSQTWRSASSVLTSVEGWLRNGIPAGVTLEDIEGKLPPLNKGESLPDGILRLQRRGRELKADLARISAAPFPSAHVRAKIRQEVEMLAARGMPVVSDVIEHDRSLVWPLTRLQANVYDGEKPTFASTEVVDTLALFAFIHQRALLDALDKLVSDEQDDAAALTHTERETRAAVVQGDLLAVEYDEAALTWAAIEQRLPVEFRADCAAQCILQVRLVTAPRTNGSTGSSPEHAYDVAGSLGRR